MLGIKYLPTSSQSPASAFVEFFFAASGKIMSLYYIDVADDEENIFEHTSHNYFH